MIFPVHDNKTKNEYAVSAWPAYLGYVVSILCSAQSPTYDQFLKNAKANADAVNKNSPPASQNQKNLAAGCHESIKNGHLRMDPEYKDIFINDPDGLFKT